MAEFEKELTCSNCEATYRIMYEDEGVDYLSPDTCPFCGELINEIEDEFDEELNELWDEDDETDWE